MACLEVSEIQRLAMGSHDAVSMLQDRIVDTSVRANPK
jgi:hypothetical protein